jgi:glutamate-ammonia-ligase adenylyltransferase
MVMNKENLKKEIVAQGRALEESLIDDFLTRMDRDYFSLYEPGEIAEHIAMARRLDPLHPVALQIIPRGDRRFQMTVVAFDYFSEFSILCGLLSSFGLNIQAGDVHTFSDIQNRRRDFPPFLPKAQNRAAERRGPTLAARETQRKIVDVFQVEPIEGERFDAPKQKTFEAALEELILLLHREAFQEARNQVNNRLIQYLGIQKEAAHGLLQPMKIRFDNRRSSQWTLLDIRGKDTPGFLYAFSNALAMRNIYIHKVKIKNIGDEMGDRLYISDRRGRKITKERDKKALAISAVLIKQFTHFLTGAPDPTKAIAHFDRLLDQILEAGESRPLISLLKQNETLNILARLFGTSDFLWEDFLRMHFENLLPLVEQFKKKELKGGKAAMRRALQQRLRKGTTLEEKKRILNEFKDREMFRIDMKHLLASHGALTLFSEALTDLAEVVVEQACRICETDLVRRYGTPFQEEGNPAYFSLCALGKFGGRELGYASDIELLFVYSAPGETDGAEPIGNRAYFEKLSQQIIDLIEAKKEGIFQIDTRLRPYGTSGALASPLLQLKRYYAPDGEAAPFERQALIKLRWVAGDEILGRKVEAIRDRFTYGNTPWDLTGALALRERQVTELVPSGRVNVKYSRGGLLDIEYLVQYLQIIYGEDHPAIRSPNTLDALQQLCKEGILSEKIGRDIQAAYLFLRRLIDALRIVRGHAKDLVLPERSSEEFTFLSRRMGYGQQEWEKGRKQLEEAILHHMTQARALFLSVTEKVLTQGIAV